MQTIEFNNIKIEIHQTKEHNLLISNSQFADLCAVFESLLKLTFTLNEFTFKENKHYVYINKVKYWTKSGMLRMIMLLLTVEALEFADFLEEL